MLIYHVANCNIENSLLIDGATKKSKVILSMSQSTWVNIVVTLVFAISSMQNLRNYKANYFYWV